MTCRLLFVLGSLRQSPGFYRSFGDILETATDEIFVFDVSVVITAVPPLR
jgi:hypothetical protein